MTHKGKEFSDIYDLIALRVLTDSERSCYSVLGAAHSLWHPLTYCFKDYIATPKANGYQSLHTTVIGLGAHPIEIQIRTYKMHDTAEYGIAAHWLYKRSGNSDGKMSDDDKSIDSRINQIRRSLDWIADEDMGEARKFLQDLRTDLFEDEIFVFTPKGEVMSLSRGSTPLDFAYAVHTEVGNHCVGALVNGKVVPFTYHLKIGDRIKVLTNKQGKPSRDWLNIVTTQSSKAKIRKYFTTLSKTDDAERGRSELARELRKKGYGISTARTQDALEQVAVQLDYRRADDLFAAIGTGKVSCRQTTHRVVAVLEANSSERQEERERRARLRNAKKQAIAEDKPLMTPAAYVSSDKGRRRSSCGVVVKGDPDLLAHLARCCNPVMGDDIVGFITRGRGVSVHRNNCPNVQRLMEHPERMIDVEWDTTGATEFHVEIVVEACDRMGLIEEVGGAIRRAGGNILSTMSGIVKGDVARMRYLIAISDASLLDPLLALVSNVPSVFDCRRIMAGEGAKTN